jgi:rhodanese-related sulfurtransferase
MRQLTAQEAHALLDTGDMAGRTLLDVRQPFEYQEMHIPGARLVPLAELPDRLEEIDKTRPVLVYCRSGHRSAAAAGILESNGFDVFNLQGGISAWQGAAAVGEPHQGLEFCLGAQDAASVWLLACGLEMVLQEFYEDFMSRAETQDLRLAFRQLAGFEVRHRERIYRLYAKGRPGALEREAFELEARRRIPMDHSGHLAEGGVEPRRFAEESGLRVKDARDALELAMQFEAQALDFYSRCARGADSGEAAGAMRQMAQEERAHLRMVAGLLERQAGIAPQVPGE